MSRAYGMEVAVREHRKNKVDAIFRAAKQEWHFKSQEKREVAGAMVLVLDYAEGYLCGGESEEEFADRLALAIWRANGGYCEVTVHATYLEDQPMESHLRDEEDFERLKDNEHPASR